MNLLNKRFACKQCGTCCRWLGYVYLTDGDITNLSKAQGLSEDAFIAHYTRLSPNRQGLCLAGQTSGACVFLQGNRCIHYDVRPVQCRAYPETWCVLEGCPGFD